MFRFRSHVLVRFCSNGFQLIRSQAKYLKNVNKLPLNPYSTNSDVLGAASSLSKISDNLREKRLNSLKRNTSSDWDVLSESLIKATTIEQIIELLSSHVNVMNNRQLTAAFESIHDIVKLSNNSNEDSLKILSSNHFKQLCNQTVKRIRFFQTTEVLATLKCLLNLNISVNTTIVQSLLQMSRQLINDFTLNEIIFLEFLLRKQVDDKRQESDDMTIPETEFTEGIHVRPKSVIPLVEALKLAIPLVLQLKIESKELDLDDIELVCKCLRIAAKHNLKDEVINKLTAMVNKHLHELTISQTYSVIASLISLNTTNTQINTNLTERVINQCLNRVTETGQSLTPGVYHNLILSVINSRNRRNFYHKGLYEMVANIIIQNESTINNSRITGVLWALTKQSHVHYGLLDLMARKLYQRDLDLIDSNKTSFTNILQAFALPSNYRPHEVNSEVVYKNILSSNHVMLSKQQKTEHLLFKILRHFAVLNYYPKQEIRDWIENNLESSLSQSTLMNFRIELIENLRILYQGLCLESNFDDFQEVKEVLKPLVEELNAFNSKLFDEKYKSNTLEFALSQGLGGHQFIANNVVSDFGHNIDHLIVMRKGGYPLPIDTQSLKKPVHISDLEIPDDSDLIGIIPLTRKDFCREPVIRKGETDFRLRTLEKTGIITIPVILEDWEPLAEIEKIPFIMREIQDNLNSKQSKIKF